jgi:hypothetical protein
VIYQNIGVGTTLKALERLNVPAVRTRRIRLALLRHRDVVARRAPRRRRRLRLRHQTATGSGLVGFPGAACAYDATIGDRLFKSSDRNMQYLNPKVYEVLLLYR